MQKKHSVLLPMMKVIIPIMNENYDDNDDYNGGDADDDDNDNVADYEVGDVAVTADDGSYLYTNQFPFPIVYIV